MFDGDEETKTSILSYCFANLKHFLESRGEILEPPAELNQLGSFPLYVTYLKNEDLRGCKGTSLFGDFEQRLKPLGDYLKATSLLSAMNDSRFDPMQVSELPDLSVSISILHSFEHIDDAFDWEIGVHGLTLEIIDGGDKKQRGTYLPNVAADFGWSKEETLEHLVKKVDYEGEFKNVNDVADFWRYQSVFFEIRQW